MVAGYREEAFYTHIPFLLSNTKLRHLYKQWYPGGIQMMHTVVHYCQKLLWGLNKYQNKLFAPSNTLFYVINGIYVIFTTTPYKIN